MYPNKKQLKKGNWPLPRKPCASSLKHKVFHLLRDQLSTKDELDSFIFGIAVKK